MKDFEKMNGIKENIEEMIDGRAKKGRTEKTSGTKELQEKQAAKKQFDFNITGDLFQKNILPTLLFHFGNLSYLHG